MHTIVTSWRALRNGAVTTPMAAEILIALDDVPDDLADFFEVIDPRSRHDVWTYASRPGLGGSRPGLGGSSHFAVMSPDLVEPCILAGSPKGGTVLDPFGGAMTTAMVAERLDRNAVACELNEGFAAEFSGRVKADGGVRIEPRD